MTKRLLSTRIDERVFDIARRLAVAENLTFKTLVEFAILDYAAQRGVAIPSLIEIRAKFGVSEARNATVDPGSSEAAQ